MVAGPQVAYFNPQILMEEDVHAPAAPGLPGIDAQGAAFVGINLYVQLGRGRDYAWSATSAGQDNIDTFARRPVRSRRRQADDQLDALPLSRPVPAVRGARAAQPVDPDARRPDAAGRADATRRAHEDGPRRRPRHRPRQAGRVHEAALDLLPRGRLRRRLHGLQHARGGPQPGDLPARGEQGRLHVQLVLRGLQAHRVLQLRRQPGAREAHQCGLPRARAVRVARLEPGRLDRRGSWASRATRGRSTSAT